MLQQLQRDSAHHPSQASRAEKHLYWVPALLPALLAATTCRLVRLLLLLLSLLLAFKWAGGGKRRARWRRCSARGHLQSGTHDRGWGQHIGEVCE